MSVCVFIGSVGVRCALRVCAQVLAWWENRVEYNEGIAKQSLAGRIHLWWSIHSRNSVHDHQNMIDEVWREAQPETVTRLLRSTSQSNKNQTQQLRDEARSSFIERLFSYDPSSDWIESILQAMHLRRSSPTERRVYKHDALRWWKSVSVRGTGIFETAWADVIAMQARNTNPTIGFVDFVSDCGESKFTYFRNLVLKLLKPSKEDLRTALAEVEDTRKAPPTNVCGWCDLQGVDEDLKDVKAWWYNHVDKHLDESIATDRLNTVDGLCSLLADENRVTSHFEQQADAPGPAEQDLVIEDQQKKEQERLDGWLADAALAEDDDAEDEVRVSMETSEIGSSKIDRFLAQWRHIHDHCGAEIPPIEAKWVDAWKPKAITQRQTRLRMTRGTVGERRADFDEKILFSRVTLISVFKDLLSLTDDVALMLFKELDSDSTGEIDRDRAQQWWDETSHLGQHFPPRFELAWTSGDIDCSNSIDFTEFRTFIDCLVCPTDSDIDAVIDEITRKSKQERQQLQRQRSDNESRRDYTDRLRRELQQEQQQQQERQKRQQKQKSKNFAEALKRFQTAKDLIEHLNPSTALKQRRRDLLSKVNESIRKATQKQQKFKAITVEPWEKGRKYLPSNWESSCTGTGSSSFFSRHILKSSQPAISIVDSDQSATESGTEGANNLDDVNMGAIRCAFRVTLPGEHGARQQEEDRRWEEYKALMSPHPVVVRLYVLNGKALRAMDGNSSTSYLVATLGKQGDDRKKTAIRKSLNPEWREMFEFETTLPGPAVLKLHVKHRSMLSKDKDIGCTEIDLERRYFCEQWRRQPLCDIETRALTAKGLKKLAARYGSTGHGSVQLWVDIHRQYSGVPLPAPISIMRPPTQKFQLRLIIWSAEHIPLNGTNKVLNCNNMFCSAQLRTAEGGRIHEESKETDTHWRATGGRGEFNYRMKFDFQLDPRLPVQQPCSLTLKVWDKEPLRFTKQLLGYKELNISSMLTDCLRERLDFLRRVHKIEDQRKVGNVQELQRLLERYKHQNKEAENNCKRRDEESSRERYTKLKKPDLGGDVDAGTQDESSGCKDLCCGCSCCPNNAGDLSTILDPLTEEKTEIDLLHATHEYRRHNLRCLHLQMQDDSSDKTKSRSGKPTVWATLEVMHMSVAEERPCGDSRDEPNEHPVLEEPEREKIGFGNMIGSLSTLVGPKLARRAKMLLLVIVLLFTLVEIVPKVSSEFALQALRKGLPMPCGTGFERAHDVYKEACGENLYGPYLSYPDCSKEEDTKKCIQNAKNAKYRWKPPLARDVLECLGPEVCPGFDCKGEDGEWYTHSSKWYETYPLRDAAGTSSPEWNNSKLKELMTPLCTTSASALEPRVERHGKFNLYNISGTKYRYAVDSEIRRVFYHENQAGQYKDIYDPGLHKIVERRVAEKCRYGGAYYRLVFYGTEKSTGEPCDQLRESPGGNNTFWRFWRQDGLDGWLIWRQFGIQNGPCKTGMCGEGFLTTPFLFPWDKCTSKPCRRVCVEADAGTSVECPAASYLWPVTMFGRIVTAVLVPLFLVKVAQKVLRRVLPRGGCCTCSAVSWIGRAKRTCWFASTKLQRKCKRQGACMKWTLLVMIFIMLFFFSQ